MMGRRKRQMEEAGVDISPLIDMVFILLIFFMVTTTFVKDAQVELDRPSAASANPASTKAIRVTLDKRGEVYVAGRPVRPWLLQSTVREMLRGGEDKPVLVITDEGVVEPIEESGPAKPNGSSLSQRLLDELAMQRRDILAIHLANDPALALDFMVFTLADADGHDWRAKKASTLVGSVASGRSPGLRPRMPRRALPWPSLPGRSMKAGVLGQATWSGLRGSGHYPTRRARPGLVMSSRARSSPA